MPVAGGLELHRKQLTFDYLDTVTGEVRRGQIAPADRAHLRAWLERFAGRDDVAFAVEGCTGWRYVAEELACAGVAAHLAEPADTAAARGARGAPRLTRPIPGTCGSCSSRAGSRSAGFRRSGSWSTGRCWRPITTCAPSGPRGRSGSMRSSSTRALRSSVRVPCAPGRAWPRCGQRQPAACRRPGRCSSRPRWT